jgi:hypothetical protein
MHRTGWLSGYGDLSLETLTAWASTFKIEDSNIGIAVPYVAPYAAKGRCVKNPDSHTGPKQIQCTQCETCLPLCTSINPATGVCEGKKNVQWVNGNASLPTRYNMTRVDKIPKCSDGTLEGSSFGPSMTCTQPGSYPGAHTARRLVFIRSTKARACYQDQLRDKRTEARRSHNNVCQNKCKKQSLRMASSSAECVSTALCPG